MKSFNPIRKLSRQIKKKRITNSLHKLVRSRRLWAARFGFPELVDIPPGKRVMVLSPHPDDDVIGAGGTLAKHAAFGAKIHSIVLTDGGRGDPDGRYGDIVQQRKEEARNADSIIGIRNLTFLGYQDGNLTVVEDHIDELHKHIRDYVPDLIYLPFFLDTHPDHRATMTLAAEAVKRFNRNCICCFYETWVPLLPNIIVDISHEMTLKLNAIAAHESQLHSIAFTDLAEGMARYRTGQYSASIRYAEAFIMMNRKDFLEFYESIVATG